MEEVSQIEERGKEARPPTGLRFVLQMSNQVEVFHVPFNGEA